MSQSTFHHALKIQKEICIGCAHCMNVCPTGALRVREGKAVLLEERCVDCGECYRSCPVSAISVEQDDFNRIYNFNYSIVLVPEILFGQFPEDIDKNLITEALQEIGFNEVVEVEEAAEILKNTTSEYIRNTDQERPLISAFCPAIVRLIQVRFPSLVDHIILQKPPLNLAAIYYKKKLCDQGIDPDNIGIFYVTQCAAKIAAVKRPVGDTNVNIDGVINLDYLYNKIYSTLKTWKDSRKAASNFTDDALSPESVKWSLTHGEADNCEGRCLAIDGIHNVIEILEKVEDGEMDDVDFLELRACDESCAGGILNPANRFLTVERLRNKAQRLKKAQASDQKPASGIHDYKRYLLENIELQPVSPRSIMKLDEDMTRALKKMRKLKDLMNTLPGVDCGVCGTPSCSALAEDIVNHKASLKDCIFIQRKYEHNNLQRPEDSYEIMKHIWGKNKLNNNY
ncbi:MAG: [Fe-Fe] hydrogenase large subunit C-terminal domain-containing protein [Bacteroidales bacterium]